MTLPFQHAFVFYIYEYKYEICIFRTKEQHELQETAEKLQKTKENFEQEKKEKQVSTVWPKIV